MVLDCKSDKTSGTFRNYDRHVPVLFISVILQMKCFMEKMLVHQLIIKIILVAFLLQTKVANLYFMNEKCLFISKNTLDKATCMQVLQNNAEKIEKCRDRDTPIRSAVSVMILTIIKLIRYLSDVPDPHNIP